MASSSALETPGVSLEKGYAQESNQAGGGWGWVGELTSGVG